MILPNPQTGNTQTDYLFQLIDEKLSELYSIHGNLLQRSLPSTPTLKLTQKLSQFDALTRNSLYESMIPRAAAYVTETGVIQWSFNLGYLPGNTVSRTSAGNYRYSFLVRPPDENYVFICTPNQSPTALPSFVPVIANKQTDSFTVLIQDSGGLQDHNHNILIFGNWG